MSDYILVNGELYHHGIKGMRWGIRRTKNKLSSSRKKSTDNWSDDAKNAAKIKKKSVNQMSNQELRQLNERIQLEQNYSRLNPNTARKGLNFVKASAAVMGTALTLYNNSDKIVSLGKKVVEKLRK